MKTVQLETPQTGMIVRLANLETGEAELGIITATREDGFSAHMRKANVNVEVTDGSALVLENGRTLNVDVSRVVEMDRAEISANYLGAAGLATLAVHEASEQGLQGVDPYGAGVDRAARALALVESMGMTAKLDRFIIEEQIIDARNEKAMDRFERDVAAANERDLPNLTPFSA